MMISKGRFIVELVLQTVVAVAIAYIIASLGRAVYNVYWHPLARFPGPKLRAAFQFPDVWSKLRGKGSRDTKALHDQYGRIVRIAPDELSFNTPQAWKDIYGLKSDRSELSKCPRFFKHRGVVHILIADQAQHTRIRRILAPAFTERALTEQEPIFKHHFDLLVTKLRQRAGAPGDSCIDLMPYFNFITFDIIGDLALGEAYGALESEEFQSWMRDGVSSIKMMGMFRLAINYPAIGLIFGLLVKLKPSIKENWKRSQALSWDKLKRRLDRQTDRKDFISYITQGESGLTYREILVNARIMLIAGSETTATHLCGAMWFLMSNLKSYERAKSEVRAYFKSPEEMTLAAVSSAESLPYLNAVIQEALRCYPSVPSTMPRITGPSGDVIEGLHIPGNTSVGVHHWSAYHNADNFTAPDEFIPERWLPDAGPRFSKDQPEALQPFHVGPRACLGKNLAYFEIRSILVRLLWHFEFKLHHDSKSWLSGQNEFGLWDKPSLWAKIEPRAMADVL